ncbi:3'-5' exonuclease [Sulfobacillus harzensis]|uniref:3'-5' exonuclease n=1 Tax=Sulfobacillus harzensis TaxID=2729629 RepID=A0A7Y0L623_9FIRM|nr:3'-5' exonuclease [Sulfobacillus harzensis]NMP23115.1 3'-5' exonuclease [Sulfobacillus harzensis]
MRYWMVFDIETVPDAAAGRRWLGLAGEPDDGEVRRAMLAARRETTGQSDFLKPPFHQVVAIAAALVDGDGVVKKLGALGRAEDDEASLLRDFFHVVEELKPRLVGWNSSGFDIPTLLYRAMHHQIVTPAFYQIGEPYHGYRKRFDEESHLDLMDVLSGYGASPRVTLDEMAIVLGVPGKLSVDGSQVMDLFQEGALERIRQYCTHDVLTTTLVFMHYAYHRGWLDADMRQNLWQSARRWVFESEDSGWLPYREAWQALDGERGIV